MDKLIQYRQYIRAILQEYGQYRSRSGNVEVEQIVDEQQNHFQLLRIPSYRRLIPILQAKPIQAAKLGGDFHQPIHAKRHLPILLTHQHQIDAPVPMGFEPAQQLRIGFVF